MSYHGDLLRIQAAKANSDADYINMTAGHGTDAAYYARQEANHKNIMARHADNGIVIVESNGLGMGYRIIAVLGLLCIVALMIYGVFTVAKDFVTLPTHEAIYNINKNWGQDYYDAHVSKPWDDWRISNNSIYDKDAIKGKAIRAKNTPDYAKADITRYNVFASPADFSGRAKKEADYYTGALALECIRKAYDRCLPIGGQSSVVYSASKYLRLLASKGDLQAALDLGLIYLFPRARNAFEPDEAIEAYLWAARQFPSSSREFIRRAVLIETSTQFMRKPRRW